MTDTATITWNDDWTWVRDENGNRYHHDDVVRELRAENERLRALVDYAASIFKHCTVTDGVCCCGDNMEGHANPMNCGHSPVDHGSYAVDQWCKQHAALSQKGGV